jgi:hypothetical protein
MPIIPTLADGGLRITTLSLLFSLFRTKMDTDPRPVLNRCKALMQKALYVFTKTKIT